MKILLIAPTPPPINGQSLASKVLLDFLKEENEVIYVNINKERKEGIKGILSRIFHLVIIYIKIFDGIRKCNRIYFTISESYAGNLKDILIYLICFRKLDMMVVHLHGGEGMTGILKKNKLLRNINVYFLERIKAFVALGDTHKNMLASYSQRIKIYTVPNFAEDYIFTSESAISNKFTNNVTLRCLFVSNLIDGKGYKELVEACRQLPKDIQQKIELNLAGQFKNEAEQRKYLKIINDSGFINYHGVVSGDKKADLFKNAHVFFLPTYYPFEGQPISILEAYASGCVVVTTMHSGIPDVFTNLNGFPVEKRSEESIKDVIIQLIDLFFNNELVSKALHNYREATNLYRAQKYCAHLKSIIIN